MSVLAKRDNTDPDEVCKSSERFKGQRRCVGVPEVVVAYRTSDEVETRDGEGLMTWKEARGPEEPFGRAYAEFPAVDLKIC